MSENSFLQSARSTLRVICPKIGQRSSATTPSFGTNSPQSGSHISQKAILRHTLKLEIIKLIEKGYCYFGVGGALGFDTLAATVLLELRQVYLHIKLILVLPCMEQTKGWSATDIAIYEDIKNGCNKYTYTAEHYYSGCMHKRNRRLVDHSTVCIAYLTRQYGGTAITVAYAKKHNVRVINIADYINEKGS